MQKIAKPRNTKKRVTIVCLAILVVVLLILGYFWVMEKQRTGLTPPLPATQEDNHITDKNQPLVDNYTPSESEEKVLTPSNQSGSELEKPSITRAEQSGGAIRVSAVFTNGSSGSCILTLEKAGYEAITKTAPIIVGPSYYTCNGFLVPRTELPSAGNWTASVTHSKDGLTITSDKKIVGVQ